MSQTYWKTPPLFSLPPAQMKSYTFCYMTPRSELWEPVKRAEIPAIFPSPPGFPALSAPLQGWTLRSCHAALNRKICLEAEASSESRFSFLVKSHYSSDSALIALLNLNHFLVSWDLIKKTITALGIKVLRWSGHTCDRCEDEHL